MGTTKLYRICTEDVRGDCTRAIVSRHFDGFTLLKGTGYWKGTPEPALVIEILGTDEQGPGEGARIRALCEDLKTENHQEAVLVEVMEATHHII